MAQNKMGTEKLGFKIYALTTVPERADVGDGSGGERGTSETLPNPFGEGRAIGQLLMGSRVITVSMWRGSPRRQARIERDPGLNRNRFKANDLWRKVRFWTLLYAIRIVDSGIAMYYSLPPQFCFLPWSADLHKTPLFNIPVAPKRLCCEKISIER